VPHVRRAALIGNVLDTKTAETTAVMEALNGLAAAVFLVDSNCRVVFANLSAGPCSRTEGFFVKENDALANRGFAPSAGGRHGRRPAAGMPASV